MKENIRIAIGIAFMVVLVDYMVNRIFQAGVIVGRYARDGELDKLGKKMNVKKVIEFPFGEKEIANQNIDASKSDAAHLTETDSKS